jgi:arylsulfatase A-like enzyme
MRPSAFLLIVVVVLLSGQGFGNSTGLAAAPAPAPRPNIVLIMADDMGFSDIGCYGSEIRTPNLDALAAGGLRFTHFYNAARCCPTRASLLTGLYPHQAGVGHMVDTRTSYPRDLSDRAVTIAEALRPAGYRTRMAGKWHVTPVTDSKHNWPLQRGFERYYGTIHGAGSFYNPVSLVSGNAVIEPDRPDFYYTDALTDRAVADIAESAGQADPFFLYVAYTAPHWPLQIPESAPELAHYASTYLQGWDRLRAERHRRQIELGVVDGRWPLVPRDPEAPAWEDAGDREWQARRMAVYAAMIERLDRGIGRIVDRLRESGVLDKTLVLFLADNGGCAEELGPNANGLHVPSATRDGRPVRVGNLPSISPGPEDTYQSYGLPWAGASNTPFRRYKHWVHEGGIATPLIAHWPAVVTRKGGLTPEPGHLIDIMATCLDVAGAEYPADREGKPVIPLEGKSLRPILEGGSRPGHEAIFWEHEGNRAVHMGRWKLVSKYPGPWELYDLEADRTELHDLAAVNPVLVRDMTARYDRWAGRAGVRPWAEVQPAPAPAGKVKKAAGPPAG